MAADVGLDAVVDIDGEDPQVVGQQARDLRDAVLAPADGHEDVVERRAAGACLLDQLGEPLLALSPVDPGERVVLGRSVARVQTPSALNTT